MSTVFIHHGNNLRLRGASCINLHLYNTSASFTDSPMSQAEWQSPAGTSSCSPRNVRLQNSWADKIPGKVKELDVYYSRLERLENLEGLEWAFIMNSKVSRADIQNLTEADIKIVDSEIECLRGCDVGYGTSLNFVGSNVTLAEDRGVVVVLDGGSLTLQRSRLVSPLQHQNSQPVVVKEGGSFSVFASTEPLAFFNPTLENQEVAGEQVESMEENQVRGAAAYQVITGVAEEEHNNSRTITQHDYDVQEIPQSGSTSSTLSSSILLLLMCLALTATFHEYKYFFK